MSSRDLPYMWGYTVTDYRDGRLIEPDMALDIMTMDEMIELGYDGLACDALDVMDDPQADVVTKIDGRWKEEVRAHRMLPIV